MTEGCQLIPKIKYSTVRDTAHRMECKQVDEEQHHPVTWQVCEEVNYMVKCSDMMHGFELGRWEDKVTNWDVRIDAMTLLYL